VALKFDELPIADNNLDKNLRVLHVAHMRRPEIGVIRQMEYEQHAAELLSLPWESMFFAPHGVEGKVVVNGSNSNGWLTFKRNFYRWLTEKSKEFDLVDPASCICSCRSYLGNRTVSTGASA